MEVSFFFWSSQMLDTKFYTSSGKLYKNERIIKISNNRKSVLIHLDEHLHQQLKDLTFENNCDVPEYIERLLEELCTNNKHTKKGNQKSESLIY